MQALNWPLQDNSIVVLSHCSSFFYMIYLYFPVNFTLSKPTRACCIEALPQHATVHYGGLLVICVIVAQILCNSSLSISFTLLLSLMFLCLCVVFLCQKLMSNQPFVLLDTYCKIISNILITHRSFSFKLCTVGMS